MKRILTIVLPVVMLPVLASEVYESEIGSILQAVSSTNRMTRLNATNRIDTLMMSLSNREESDPMTTRLYIAVFLASCGMPLLAECKLLKSAVLVPDNGAQWSSQIYGKVKA